MTNALDSHVRSAVDAVVRDGQVAYLPVGSVEQHAAHLPLTTDSLIAELLTRRLASVHPGLVLPAVPVATSHEHQAWRGTVSVSSRTVSAYVEEIVRDLARQNFRVAVVNCHGGNYWVKNVIQELNADGIRCVNYWDEYAYERAFTAAGFTGTPSTDMHAGSIEYSLGLVGEFTIDTPPPSWTGDPVRRNFNAVGLQPFTPTGHIGTPAEGSADKGEKFLQSLVSDFAPLYDFLTTNEL